MMRFFRPRVLSPTDLPDEIADQARALAVALANPSTPDDERVALRRAFSKRLSTEVWSIRVAGWDEFNREHWHRYEAPRPLPTAAWLQLERAAMMDVFMMVAACPDRVSRTPIIHMVQVQAFGLAAAFDLADE